MVPQLPVFATRFESGGKTYLYADDVFYSPRPGRGGYEVVNDPEDEAQPPAESPGQPENEEAAPTTAPAPAASSASPAPSNPTAIAISPRNGQSEDQQAMDRYECYRFAIARTGFDPLAPNGGPLPGQLARRDSAYARAQAACLERRGYTVP
jgi:hypothetical protein